MKAIVYDKKSSPLKLRYCDHNQPVAGPDQVLVKVLYASINAADTRSLKMGIIPKKKIFGSAFSGRIEAIGNRVNNFKVGDAVLADVSDLGFGALAEYVSVPSNALVSKPSGLSFKDAACLPLAATTALKAVNVGRLKRGQEVLIVGASGGVGGFAIQIAKHLAATVSAVCSSANMAQAKEHGADYLIDYRKESFLKSANRYDLILAINGNYSLLGYRNILKSKGTFVMVGGSLKQIFKALIFSKILSFGTKKMSLLSAKADPKDLALLTDWAEKFILKPNIVKEYPLSESSEAMNYLLEGHAQGKVLVKIG